MTIYYPTLTRTLEEIPGTSYGDPDMGHGAALQVGDLTERMSHDELRDARPARQAPLLDLLWLELTGKCNLTCVHCYAESSPCSPLYKDMRPDDWKRVLLEAHSIGCRKAQFIGGEPTLYPALSNLIEDARCLGYELVEVYTNGTRFTRELKYAFRQFRVSLAFSVYGADQDTHDAVTQRKGSFNHTINNVTWALEAGLDVRVGIIRTAFNVRTVDQTREFLTRLGVASVAVDRQRAVGRGASGCATESSLSELCGNCGNGIACVMPSGDIFPCVFARYYPVGNVFEAGLDEILRGRKLSSFRAMLPAPVLKPASACNPDLLRGCRCTPDLLRGCKCSPDNYVSS